MSCKSIIEIFRGDDSDALGYQSITCTITTNLDLSDCTVTFRYLNFSADYTNVESDVPFDIVIPKASSAAFPPGFGYASIKVTDADGKLRTFDNRIPVLVKTSTGGCGQIGGEFTVDFSKMSYSDIIGKPQINGVTLEGDKTSEELGLQSEINDLATIRSGAALGATALQSIPTASASVLGGVKVGSNLSIDANGVLNAVNQRIDVDSALSDDSENPVQNRVIKAALDEKRDYDDLTYNYLSDFTLAPPYTGVGENAYFEVSDGYSGFHGNLTYDPNSDTWKSRNGNVYIEGNDPVYGGTFSIYGVGPNSPYVLSFDAHGLAGIVITDLVRCSVQAHVKEIVNDTIARVSQIPAAVTVDSALSTTSTNPVQNKVVTAAIAGKVSKAGDAMTGVLSVFTSGPDGDARIRAGYDNEAYTGLCTDGLVRAVGENYYYQMMQSKDGTLALTSDLDAKQDTIIDLATIRSGAAKGATSVQTVNGTAPDANGNVNVQGGVDPSILNAKLDSTSAAPVYDATATYAVDATVSYNGKLYRCTAATTAGTLPTDTSYWTPEVLASRGYLTTDGNGNVFAVIP